jgi:hypothetical protein
MICDHRLTLSNVTKEQPYGLASVIMDFTCDRCGGVIADATTESSKKLRTIGESEDENFVQSVMASQAVSAVEVSMASGLQTSGVPVNSDANTRHIVFKHSKKLVAHYGV